VSQSSRRVSPVKIGRQSNWSLNDENIIVNLFFPSDTEAEYALAILSTIGGFLSRNRHQGGAKLPPFTACNAWHPK